jgi:hypothetical protein
MRLIKTVVEFAGNNRRKIDLIHKTYVRSNGHFNLHALLPNPSAWGCSSDVIHGECSRTAPWIAGINAKKYDYGLEVIFETQGNLPVGVVHALLDPSSNPQGYCRFVQCSDVVTGHLLLQADTADWIRPIADAIPRQPIHLTLSGRPRLRPLPFGCGAT